jgi:Na+/proline symporter
MEAVIWVEVVQLGIYIAGAIAAAVVLINSINGGLAAASSFAQQYSKYSLFDFSLDHTKTFTFWSGLIGGCFLTSSRSTCRPGFPVSSLRRSSRRRCRRR